MIGQFYRTPIRSIRKEDITKMSYLSLVGRRLRVVIASFCCCFDKSFCNNNICTYNDYVNKLKVRVKREGRKQSKGELPPHYVTYILTETNLFCDANLRILYIT